MCDTEKEREISKKIFLGAGKVSEFMDLWSKFYENKICIPTYLSKFVGAEDNPEANENLGLKLKEITRRGFLGVDSQVGIPGNQKAYLVGFLPESMAETVVVELNRYSGIVAFYSDIRDFHSQNINTTGGLYVTYDALDEEIAESDKQKKMLGDPFTHLTMVPVEDFESIREWMSKPVRKKISPDKYKYITIVAPCFDAPPEMIFDRLLEVLRQF